MKTVGKFWACIFWGRMPGKLFRDSSRQCGNFFNHFWVLKRFASRNSRCGLTGDGLFNTVGIHVTNAEEVVKLDVTKRSGLDPKLAPCCS